MSFAWPEDADPQIQVLTFVALSFSYLGRHLALCRLPSTETASASRGLNDPSSWRLLRQGSRSCGEPLNALLLHADVWRLRTLLARHEYFVHRIDDHRVRAAVSQMIHRGALGLFERIDAGAASLQSTASPPARQAAEAPPPASSPATSFRTREPAEAARLLRGSPSPQASTTPTRIERQRDPIQALDQDAQAATLVVAARNGTPFCEECARRAAARAERVAA